MNKRRRIVRIYDIRCEDDGGEYNQTSAELLFDKCNTAEDYEYDTIKEWLEDDGDCKVIDFKYEFLEYDESNH